MNGSVIVNKMSLLFRATNLARVFLLDFDCAYTVLYVFRMLKNTKAICDFIALLIINKQIL